MYWTRNLKHMKIEAEQNHKFDVLVYEKYPPILITGEFVYGNIPVDDTQPKIL